MVLKLGVQARSPSTCKDQTPAPGLVETASPSALAACISDNQLAWLGTIITLQNATGTHAFIDNTGFALLLARRMNLIKLCANIALQ